VLFALALGRASGLLRSLKRHRRTIQLMNGALLILIGFALLTKQLAIIARWAQENNCLSSNSKCNTAGPDGLRCCHANEIL
jgi:hypothetical protein